MKRTPLQPTADSIDESANQARTPADAYAEVLRIGLSRALARLVDIEPLRVVTMAETVRSEAHLLAELTDHGATQPEVDDLITKLTKLNILVRCAWLIMSGAIQEAGLGGLGIVMGEITISTAPVNGQGEFYRLPSPDGRMLPLTHVCKMMAENEALAAKLERTLDEALGKEADETIH